MTFRGIRAENILHARPKRIKTVQELVVNFLPTSEFSDIQQSYVIVELLVVNNISKRVRKVDEM